MCFGGCERSSNTVDNDKVFRLKIFFKWPLTKFMAWREGAVDELYKVLLMREKINETQRSPPDLGKSLKVLSLFRSKLFGHKFIVRSLVVQLRQILNELKSPGSGLKMSLPFLNTSFNGTIKFHRGQDLNVGSKSNAYWASPSSRRFAAATWWTRRPWSSSRQRRDPVCHLLTKVAMLESHIYSKVI